MNIKSTILTVSAAALIAGSAFSFASAADGTRDLGDAPLQNGFINSDGSAVQHTAPSYGYSVKSPVSKLTGQNAQNNGSRGRDIGEAAPADGFQN